MGRLKTWLFVSVVVNVFLLGVLAGGGYRWMSEQHRIASVQQRGLRFAAAKLPADRQRQLRIALRETRRDSAPLIAAARDGRREIKRILSAPTLDEVALNAAMARTREADIALRARVEAQVASFATTLTPDERLDMVRALVEHGPLRIAAEK